MGIITKAISFGGEQPTRMFPSQRLLEDPFASAYGLAIKEPPYALEPLVFLAESQPIHAAALEQKTADVVADGVRFMPMGEGADREQLHDLQAWWESLVDEASTTELLQAVWSDYETIGWGAIEIARDPSGVVRQLYHVPGHTLRAHREGELFVQIRDARRAWFKMWGSPRDFVSSTGQLAKRDTPHDKLAHEILIFRKLSRRSSWYGIPSYISASGYITMSLAARDYNISYFFNAREPRHLIIVSGLDENVAATLDALEESLKVQMRDHHRNLLLPIQGDVKVDVQKMALPQNDMHFAKLMGETDQRILVAHRMPPDRVGFVSGGRGFTGGGTNALNTIYKEGVVAVGQSILSDRLNRFLAVEYERKTSKRPQWKASFKALNLTDEQADVNVATSLVTSDILTLNEARHRLGKPRLEALADMTWDEYRVKVGAAGGSGGGAQAPQPGAPPLVTGGDQMQERLEEALVNLDSVLEELMSADAPSQSALPPMG